MKTSALRSHRGLRRAGIDVTIPREVSLIGKSDMEHLVFANAEKRVLLTHDDDLLVLAHRGSRFTQKMGRGC